MFDRTTKTNQSTIVQYRQLRDVGKYLSEEIPKLYGLEESLPKITRLLGIGQGRKIILESDEEINFLIDFYLNEYQYHGRTLLEQYREDCPTIDSMTIAYLDAAKASYTSFFKIVDLNPKENTLVVEDFLNPSGLIEVINENLSRTSQCGFVLFSRLLPFEEFNAFSGMYAAFPNDRRLMKRYKIMKKRVKSERESVQRFVAAFKLNRSMGMEVIST